MLTCLIYLLFLCFNLRKTITSVWNAPYASCEIINKYDKNSLPHIMWMADEADTWLNEMSSLDCCLLLKKVMKSIQYYELTRSFIHIPNKHLTRAVHPRSAHCDCVLM